MTAVFQPLPSAFLPLDGDRDCPNRGAESRIMMIFSDLISGIACFFFQRLPSGTCQAEDIISGLTRSFLCLYAPQGGNSITLQSKCKFMLAFSRGLCHVGFRHETPLS
ncbi:MAG: hypothetical protein ILO10_03270 [Kiritimatiellae bacterium]|nr:hypothetical protein [Kiritimatiellia bacterium]